VSDWRLVSSLSLETEHSLVHKHSETSIVRETHTPCSGGDYTSRTWGEPKRCYYDPNDTETHDTYEDALAWQEARDE